MCIVFLANSCVLCIVFPYEQKHENHFFLKLLLPTFQRVYKCDTSAVFFRTYQVNYFDGSY